MAHPCTSGPCGAPLLPLHPTNSFPLTAPTAALAAPADQLEMVQLHKGCGAGHGWIKCSGSKRFGSFAVLWGCSSDTSQVGEGPWEAGEAKWLTHSLQERRSSIHDELTPHTARSHSLPRGVWDVKSRELLAGCVHPSACLRRLPRAGHLCAACEPH